MFFLKTFMLKLLYIRCDTGLTFETRGETYIKLNLRQLTIWLSKPNQKKGHIVDPSKMTSFFYFNLIKYYYHNFIVRYNDKLNFPATFKNQNNISTYFCRLKKLFFSVLTETKLLIYIYIDVVFHRTVWDNLEFSYKFL